MTEDYSLVVTNISAYRMHDIDRITITWESPELGFGEYNIFKEPYANDNFEDEYDQNIYAETECMDDNDDKEFTRRLMLALAEKIYIVD